MKAKLIALLGGALSLGAVTTASAADMAVKARPVVAPVLMYDWSGFYVGINGGGGWSRKCWDFTTPAGVFLVAEGCHDATGGTVGGQIGYRWQASSWVFGLEAQGNWANLRGSNISLAFPAFTNDSRINAFGLFTGQVGYAMNNALFYVKGGAAVVGDRFRSLSTVGLIQVTNDVNDSRWGATVGAGFEYGFTPNWSFALEYDHIFLGNRNYTFLNNGVVGVAGTLFGTDTIRQDVDLFTARINYKFGGPVVAKY